MYYVKPHIVLKYDLLYEGILEVKYKENIEMWAWVVQQLQLQTVLGSQEQIRARSACTLVK